MINLPSTTLNESWSIGTLSVFFPPLVAFSSCCSTGFCSYQRGSDEKETMSSIGLKLSTNNSREDFSSRVLCCDDWAMFVSRRFSFCNVTCLKSVKYLFNILAWKSHKFKKFTFKSLYFPLYLYERGLW